LKIIIISACLQPFLGFEEASTISADLVYGLSLGQGFELEMGNLF